MYDASLQPILALLGHGVGGNPTQYMVEKAIAHHELDWRYLSLDVAPERLEDAVRGMRAMGFRGGNAADPHRAAIGVFLDRRERVAELSGVVNCITRDDDQLVGHNSEGQAILAAIARHLPLAGRRVVLLGAGHVARAVGAELALAGAAEITVVNRGAEHGAALMELLHDQLGASSSFTPWQDSFPVPPETEVLIHATSRVEGDDAAPLPLDLSALAAAAVVADVTIDPPRTWLLRAAAERGCPTVDGLEILIEQVAINFKLWTEIDPNRAILHDAAEEFLEL